ncbi:DUF4249 domain-containing protein [Rubrolithibacter danxiaensis]|uniref:DUF4249 domain-containing protein n=1 Tax=Rubrolithibacter danxiaensis TaxID=3390805 RepID=UPI003BF8FE14
MTTFPKFFILIAVLIVINSCKEIYDPPVISNSASYLVVEGFLNASNDSTIINLSRTTKLSDTVKLVPEPSAVVTVEDEESNTQNLISLGNGRYGVGVLNLNSTKKYRLHIRDQFQKEYVSDFVEVKQSPEIDSVTTQFQSNGVQVSVNSHDAQNNTRYYRWDLDETWRYVSLNNSSVVYRNGVIENRSEGIPGDKVYSCWRSAKSKQILLGTSANLSSDILANSPLTFLTPESGKISFGYSVLVKQYALTKEGYIYWQNLKKNTENLGSIFDAQPSIATGNIHCVSNPGEPVIGFLSASTVSKKRIYIDFRKLPFSLPSYFPPPDPTTCEDGVIKIDPAATFEYRLENLMSGGKYLLTIPLGAPGVGIIGYFYSSKECVDCRLMGGTNIRPDFWPEN